MIITLDFSVDTLSLSSIRASCNNSDNQSESGLKKLRKPLIEPTWYNPSIVDPNDSKISSAIVFGAFLSTLESEWQGIATSANAESVEPCKKIIPIRFLNSNVRHHRVGEVDEIHIN